MNSIDAAHAVLKDQVPLFVNTNPQRGITTAGYTGVPIQALDPRCSIQQTDERLGLSGQLENFKYQGTAKFSQDRKTLTSVVISFADDNGPGAAH